MLSNWKKWNPSVYDDEKGKPMKTGIDGNERRSKLKKIGFSADPNLVQHKNETYYMDQHKTVQIQARLKFYL